MNEKQVNALKDFLANKCSDDKIYYLVRDMNSYDGSLEDYVWEDMENFNETCNGMTPSEIARACFYGHFNPSHDYFKYNAYGNFDSTDYISFDESDISDIVDAVENIPYRYLPDEITDILDENEEEDEEEEEEEE